jgi:multicomponent Na+:H+ antiporter subunit C
VSILPYIVAGWIFFVGLYGLITSRHLVHQILSLVVIQSSTYVLLVAVGFRLGGVAPYYSDIPKHLTTVDPVVQALTLTDIVVEAAVTSLLLAIALQAQRRFGSVDPEELRQLRG